MPYVKRVTKRRQILPTPEEARNSDVTAGPGLAYIRWRARAQTTPYSRKRTGAVQLGMSALGQKRTSERDWFVSCSEVLAFLGRSNVGPEFATSTENTKTEEVATLASSFTVQIICHR
jgi:hypothetical protein